MCKGPCVFRPRCTARVVFLFYFEEDLGLFLSGIFRKQLHLTFLLSRRIGKILASLSKIHIVVEYLEEFQARVNSREIKFIILSALLRPNIYPALKKNLTLLCECNMLAIQVHYCRI